MNKIIIPSILASIKTIYLASTNTISYIRME